MYTIPRTKSGSGCASKFYIMDNPCNRGFKSFEDYALAKIAHYNQTKLSEHDLAPRVYSEVGRVRIGKSKKLSDWGYITEIADLICCPGNDCNCCDRDSLEYEICDEIDQLTSDIEDIGFYFADNHPGNVGYIYRDGCKLLVCIDTGDESVASDAGPCCCLICKKGGDCRE